MSRAKLAAVTRLKLDRMVVQACAGLTITPDQLMAELTAGGDIESIETEELSAGGLRVVALTIDSMRYKK